MPKEIVICPKCCTTYKVTEDRIGRNAHCLNCKHEFTLKSNLRKIDRVISKKLPFNADDLNNRAIAALNAGDSEKAGILFEKALTLDPNHLESSYNRGLMLWRSGIIDDLKLVEQIKEISTSGNNEWKKEYLLGLVHMERSDAELAVKALEKSDSLRPDNLDVKYALKKAKSGVGKWLKCVKTLKGHDNDIEKVLISPDGNYVISACTTSVRLWDLDAGKCFRKLKKDSEGISALAFTPDGKYVLLGCLDGKLRLLDPSRGRFIQKFEGHKYSVAHFLAISPDGIYAISAGRSLKLWDLSTGDLVRKFDEHSNEYSSIAVDPSGNYLISSVKRDLMHPWWGGGEIKLWELSSGRCLQVLENKDNVDYLTFCANGRHVVSCCYKNIKIWDLQTAECIKIYYFRIYKASISLDGRYALLVMSKEKTSLFDLNSGKVKRSFGLHPNAISISSDGKYAVIGSPDKKLRIWELTTDTFRAGFKLSKTQRIEEKIELMNKFSILIKSAEKTIKDNKFQEANSYLKEAKSIPGYQSNAAISKLSSQLLKIGFHSELKSSRCLRTFKTGNSPVSISADGKYALTGGPELNYWDLSTGKCLRTFGRHYERIAAAAISPDGRYALSVESGAPYISQAKKIKKFRVWDLATGKCLKEIDGHSDYVVALAFSPDGKCVLSGSQDRTLKLWELASGKCLMTYKGGRSHSIEAVSFSPDGRCAISAGGFDKTLKLWELASGECLRTFEGHSNRIADVVFSPDGKYALSGSWDKTLKLWEVVSGKCLRTFEGHSDFVSSILISPDGKFAFSGSFDSTIKIWELLTGKCLSTLKGHLERIDSIAISPDGKHLLSGSPRFAGDSNPKSQLLKLWYIDWNYEFPEKIVWDMQIRPYLEIFLEKFTENWTEENWANLKRELQLRGLGWVSPKGVRNQLKELTCAYLKNGENWFKKRYGVTSKKICLKL